MSRIELLSVDEVREFVSDYAPNNYLIEGEEFTPTYVALCRDLAVDSYNEIPPLSSYNLTNFPSKSMLLYATLWKMYDGKAALLARNTMSYSDGGLQIPIEERMELYMSLAQNYRTQFMDSAQKLKIHLNMESGWSEVRSDEASFPLY
jgi:hypothetical protein